MSIGLLKATGRGFGFSPEGFFSMKNAQTRTRENQNKHMAQHRRNRTAVHLPLRSLSHIKVLARKDRCFNQGTKEAILVRLEEPSINSGESHDLSSTYKGAEASPYTGKYPFKLTTVLMDKLLTTAL